MRTNLPLAQYDGHGAQSHGMAAAQSGASQTTKEACRDRRHCRPYGQKDHEAVTADNVKRLSIECQATVRIGEVARGGLTRGDNQACDHDVGRCGDEGGVGQNSDVEGPSPHRRAEPEGLSKGSGAEQAGHAGGSKPVWRVTLSCPNGIS